ncbi:dihydrofolate reductase family protein [Phenylobacterium terrae]|uniref:Dihydrofolate reductase family protein n=1 Tax=Phenylobacterium terrae TaxID=2665495 RepID=A0ABW4N4Q3_9CAUL
MRRIVDAVFISLDGVIQAPGGPEEDPTGGFTHGGWVAPWFDDKLGEHIDQVMSDPFDLLLGRKTYEIFAAHWPYAEPGDTIGEKFKTLTKYVATRSREPLGWGPAVALHDAAADVARLKQEDGPTLLIQGSSELVQTLLEADLIDELHLIQIPVLLGKGKSVFSDRTRPGAMKHTGTKVTTTGVVISSYLRAGEVQTGSFEFETPTDAELARREKMKREG